jgi:hypothetical protein
VAVVRDGDGYIVRARDLAEVRFDRFLRHGWCRPGPAFGAEHLRDLMTTILSVWMVLNGVAVFHGSSVSAVPGLEDETALAFVGGSFAGKFTWAALLCAEGARFITDDALPVVNHQGRPTLTGACPEMRLRTFSESQWPAFNALARRQTVDGRVAVTSQAPVGGAVPIGAVVVLQPHKTGDGVPGTNKVMMEQLGPHDAMLALAANHRVPGVTLVPAQVAYFQRAAEVAETVPVWLVKAPPTRPHRSWAELLLANLQGRGVCS